MEKQRNLSANILANNGFTLGPTEGHQHDPNFLREQARRCRLLSKTAVEPEVIEQFRVWAVDLAEEADQADRRDIERERLTDR